MGIHRLSTIVVENPERERRAKFDDDFRRGYDGLARERKRFLYG
jgi:hypothetical protein